jgi:RimJ/RimL family protein N-acetyltransferase
LIEDALPRTTDRLCLRRFSVSDLDRFQSYRCDPEVGRYQGWSALDDAGAAAFLGAMAVARIGVPGEWFQIAVAERCTGDLIGDIGVGLDKHRDGVAEIGFTIAPAAHGRGLAAEAVVSALAWLFATGKVDIVEAITDARNAPSIRLLERVGMHLDRMQQAPFKGEMSTEHVYLISRANWIESAQVNSGNPR